jgi:hypothetical protein
MACLLPVCVPISVAESSLTMSNSHRAYEPSARRKNPEMGQESLREELVERMKVFLHMSKSIHENGEHV